MRCSLIVIAFISLAVTASAQQRKVTVVTTAGDTLEGTLTSADADNVVVTVVGRPLTLKQSEIKYISFVGKVDAAATGAPGDLLSKALAALGAINSTVEVGVLREQYSEKLVEHVPPIVDFIKSPDNSWTNVKAAMRAALVDYQEPLRTIESWKYGAESMSTGHAWAKYAEELSRRPDEQTAREKDAEVTITEPQPELKGRLALGDRQMTKEMDPSSAGGLYDRYLLTLAQPGRLAVQMACLPCRPQLTLLDSAGKSIASNDGGVGKPAKIEKSLQAGTYVLLSGTFSGQVGDYSLAIKY